MQEHRTTLIVGWRPSSEAVSSCHAAAGRFLVFDNPGGLMYNNYGVPLDDSPFVREASSAPA